MTQTQWLSSHATLDELTKIIGPGKWAICRKTPKNLARYGRCFTRKEFASIQAAAIATRSASR